MSENKDFELFGGAPTAREGSEQSDETFQEEMRQGQAAMAQLKKEEGKAKANDDKLSKIIVQFLSQPGNTDLFLLISRCVAQNIPSEVLIAVLSLVDRTAFVEMDAILKEVGQTQALVAPQTHTLGQLSGGQKQVIADWLKNIHITAMSKPQRSLESMLVKKTDAQGEVVQQICLPFVQLTAFIMRNYLILQQSPVEYEILHDFIESVYVQMIRDLEALVDGQKKLA